MKKVKSSQKNILQYDPESDVAYLGIKKGVEEEYKEIAPGIHIELDEEGKVIGIEIMNASRALRPIIKKQKEKEHAPARK